MKRLLSVAVAACMLLPALAMAQWRVETRKDAMTDEVRKAAKAINASGHELNVYRGPRGAVWVMFSVTAIPGETVSPRRAPMLRVDQHAPHDQDGSRHLTERKLGDTYQWEPGFVNFVIWHGVEAQGRSPLLQQLLTGEQLVVRYWLSTGGYKDTAFSLAGAGPAIAEALGIPVVLDPAVQARADARRRLAREYTARCTNDAAGIECRRIALECMKQTESDPDTTGLEQCLRR